MSRIVGFLRLMRPANIVTAIADIFAGLAIGGSLVSATWGGLSETPVSLGELILRQSGPGSLYLILLLVLATIGLYGGGVVLNDVFDAELDKTERPERPIPSGLISKTAAAVFGMVLLLLGIAAAALTQPDNIFSVSTALAIIIAFAALVYDKWMKHHAVLGPLNMGLCRGLNLLLGMSLVAYSIQFYWFIAILPVVYIAAITMISRGEVHGGKRTTLYTAAVFYIVVIIAIILLSIQNNTLVKSLPFLVIFCILIFPPLQRAIIKPEGPKIGKAVKSGVIALILMDASLAAAFGDIFFALLILLLFPFSFLLARLFAVT